ncbi:inositol monophosphatase family protein [Paracoccus litorisediminis]
MTSDQTISSPEPMTELALSMADAVRPLIAQHFRKRLTIETKDDASPVTIADREAEALMRAMIADAFPDHGIRGEEFGLHQADAEWVWVLDPIDGTKSFISGSLAFGTQIALLYRGRPVLGLIDQPITGERWLGRTGLPTLFGTQPIRCSSVENLADAVLYTSARDHFDGTQAPRYDRLACSTRFNRSSHDCYAAGLLALGLVDILAEANVYDYDILPQAPIILGAGGIITDWAGLPLPDGRVFDTVLISANAVLHRAALAALKID